MTLFETVVADSVRLLLERELKTCPGNTIPVSAKQRIASEAVFLAQDVVNAVAEKELKS